MTFKSSSSMIAIATSAALLLLMSFQNCAPTLPLEGVVDASSKRATATPGPLATPGPGGTGTYTGTEADGTCTDDTTTQPMAVKYTASGGGTLIAFTKPDGSAALWKIKDANVFHGVVCSLKSSSSTPWYLAGIGDFNADFQQDVVWRNPDGRVAIWLMNGANRSVSRILTATMPPDWRIEGTGQFDGDGKADILWRNVSTGALKKWSMNGALEPTEVSLGTLPMGFTILGLGDFDGNYRTDILYRENSGGRQISIKFIAPDGSVANDLALTGAAAVSSTQEVRAIGDFNGDARADFVVQSGVGGALEIRYMAANTIYAPAYPIAAPVAGWNLLYATDTNSDGVADWIWTLPGPTDPYLAYTPMSGTPGTTRTLDTVSSGWTVFTYTH